MLELPWRACFRPRDLATATSTEQGDEHDNFKAANREHLLSVLAMFVILSYLAAIISTHDSDIQICSVLSSTSVWLL
jgi:hypothetical protein